MCQYEALHFVSIIGAKKPLVPHSHTYSDWSLRDITASDWLTLLISIRIYPTTHQYQATSQVPLNSNVYRRL